MRFSVSAAVLAFAASAFAQTTSGFDAITAPAEGEEVSVGETYPIVWQPGSVTGTITLALLGGASPSTLNVIDSIAAGVDNTLGTYDWVVDSSVAGFATYGIQITLDSNTSTLQYGFPFHIVGGSDDTSSSTASSSSYPTTSVVSSSSAPAEVTSTSSSAAEEYPVTTASSIDYPTATATGNGTAIATTSTGAATTLTSATTVKTSATTSAATTSSTVVSTNGAPRAAAGSIALIGGIVAAIFTL